MLFTDILDSVSRNLILSLKILNTNSAFYRWHSIRSHVTLSYKLLIQTAN